MPPLNFGTTATTIPVANKKKPLFVSIKDAFADNTKLGIAKNTILGIPRASKDLFVPVYNAIFDPVPTTAELEAQNKISYTPEGAEQEKFKLAAKAGVMPLGNDMYADPFMAGTLKRVGSKAVAETVPAVFQGLKGLSTRLLEKFKGLPNEITQQQFNEVINKAQKEGIKKADLDLVKEMMERQSGGYRYHTTSLKGLFGIQKEGLKPAKGQYGKGVYFAPTEELTKGYDSPDEIMVRIKKSKLPQDYDEFPEQGWTSETVKPDNLEYRLKSENKWFDVKTNKEVSDKISLPQLAKDVETQLVPLTPTPVKSPRWSSVGEEFIGDGKYGEIVYQSPIKTSAGDVHYSSREYPSTFNSYDAVKASKDSFPNYFSHVRYEDLPNPMTKADRAAITKRMLAGENVGIPLNGERTTGGTRKILETQSDLMQKENFQKEIVGRTPANYNDLNNVKYGKMSLKAQSEIDKLQPYNSNDPLAHLRTFREEVKRAAKDGKDTLLIPSGETAMKIEGLGKADEFVYYTPTKKIDSYTENITITDPSLFPKKPKSAVGNLHTIDMYDLNGDVAEVSFIWLDKNGLTTPTVRKKIPLSSIEGGVSAPKRLNSNNMKVGLEIEGKEEVRMIITDILGDGKFKAVPKDKLTEQDIIIIGKAKNPETIKGIFNSNRELANSIETFDISGKVDTKHFVYKLNEEAIPREARKMGLEVTGKIKQDGGVWWQIKIPTSMKDEPVTAFGQAKIGALAGVAGATAVGAGAMAGADKMFPSLEYDSGHKTETYKNLAPKIVDIKTALYGKVYVLENGIEVRSVHENLKEPIAKTYQNNPEMPKGLLEALLMKESQMGRDNSNADPQIGKYAWLGGVTKIVKQDLIENGIVPDLETKEGVLDAMAKFWLLRADPNVSVTENYDEVYSSGELKEEDLEKFDTFYKFYANN